MLNFNIRKTVFYSKYKAEFFLLLATILWGSTFTITKIVLNAFSPLGILFYRFYIAFFLLFLFLSIKKKLKLNFVIISYGFLLGILGFLGYYLQTYGLMFTTPSRSAFFTQTFIVYVYFIELFILKKRIDKNQWTSLVLILLGAYFMLFEFYLPWHLFFTETLTLKGDLFTIASALCFALYLIVINYIKEDFLNVLLVHFFFIFSISFFFTPILDLNHYMFEFFLILILSILGTLFASLIMFLYQPKLNPIKASILYSLEPVFAFFFSSLLINLKYTFGELLGSLLIFIGSLFGAFKNSKNIDKEI
ncbi:MAG: DMT family transporter [Leptonema sp. (in: bacteria)]